MAYSVTCVCGRAISVTENQACLEIPCRCGELVSVPSLDRLRTMPGQGVGSDGTIGRIRQMVSAGELPWGEVCVCSGRRTTDRLDFVVECEGADSGTTRGLSYLLATLMSLFFGVMGTVLTEFWRDATPAGGRGRVVAVRVPLLVGAEYHGEILAMRSQRRLREMLRSVPVYEELLVQYPSAAITVIAPRP